MDVEPTSRSGHPIIKIALCGVVAGATLCLAGILRIAHVRDAWERTTFHPDWEMDTPAFFVCLGVVVMVTSLMVGLFGWQRGRGT
jgi:hypothetical protein